MIKLNFTPFITAVIFILSQTVCAQTFIKTTDDWSAFKGGTGKSKYCYIGSAPIKEKGNYKRRDDRYVLLTHRPPEKQFDVFELRAGYTYKKKSTVVINIDSQKFELFTSGGTAWAKKAKTDRALARAMIRGRIMTVSGTSSRGTRTLDTYSLKGFTAAYNAIGKNCGKE